MGKLKRIEQETILNTSVAVNTDSTVVQKFISWGE